MDTHWWQLRGPSRYVQSVIADLQSGMNVILRFPAQGTNGFREALRARVRENDSWRWRSVDAASLDAGTAAELAAQLHDVLRCRIPPGSLASPANLAESLPDLDVIWVENICLDRWPVWATFIAQFQHACQSRQEDRRGLFCLPLIGQQNAAPVADTALSERQWKGEVSRLDVMMYLDQVMATRFPSQIHRRVALAVATELAGADATLGIALAAAGDGLLTDPLSVLKEVTHCRGWTECAVAKQKWEDGVLDYMDGEQRVNSAALVLIKDNGRDEISRRIWSGQVSVLYPFIEVQRVRLVPHLSGFLDLPVETTYGQVDAAIDLEVGELVHFLRRKPIPDRLWRQLNLLKDMRHALAHLKPVPSDLLLSREMEELARLSSGT